MTRRCSPYSSWSPTLAHAFCDEVRAMACGGRLSRPGGMGGTHVEWVLCTVLSGAVAQCNACPEPRRLARPEQGSCAVAPAGVFARSPQGARRSTGRVEFVQERCVLCAARLGWGPLAGTHDSEWSLKEGRGARLTCVVVNVSL